MFGVGEFEPERSADGLGVLPSRLLKSLATNRHQFLSLRRSRWTPEKNKELMRSLRGWLPRRSSKQLLVLSKETGL